MTDQPRNWDKELADIDRVIAGSPALPAAGGAPAVPSAPMAPSGRPVPGHTATVGTWLRVCLALALAVAMPFWPYAKDCGLGLAAYLAAVGMVAVAGLWAAVSGWQRHRARAHVAALLVMLWGFALAAHEILPRIGYAKQSAVWVCGS